MADFEDLCMKSSIKLVCFKVLRSMAILRYPKGLSDEFYAFYF